MTKFFRDTRQNKFPIKILRNSQGFTLIEILIATLILALALSAVFVGLGQSTRGLAYLENKTSAFLSAYDGATLCTLGVLTSATGSITQFNQNYTYHQNGQQVTATGQGASANAFCARVYAD